MTTAPSGDHVADSPTGEMTERYGCTGSAFEYYDTRPGGPYEDLFHPPAGPAVVELAAAA